MFSTKVQFGWRSQGLLLPSMMKIPHGIRSPEKESCQVAIDEGSFICKMIARKGRPLVACSLGNFIVSAEWRKNRLLHSVGHRFESCRWVTTVAQSVEQLLGESQQPFLLVPSAKVLLGGVGFCFICRVPLVRQWITRGSSRGPGHIRGTEAACSPGLENHRGVVDSSIWATKLGLKSLVFSGSNPERRLARVYFYC